MIEQLKNIFPSLIVDSEEKGYVSETYQWFLTHNGEKIGIAKQELSEKDGRLMRTFLTPYQGPPLTKKEKVWKQIIDQNFTEAPTSITSPYRFVYFSMNKNQINPGVFKESIQTLFDYSVPIIWENEHEGILIEEKPIIAEESISYEQIIDILMSDLYVNIHFFVGPYSKNYKDAKHQYKSLLTYANRILTYTDKSVISYKEAIPHILVGFSDQAFREYIAETILQEFTDDTDLLQTIHTFLQCNLNVSVAAKDLYMHRNSLQYRLDKFIEKTGIDIRQFHQATTVYLALLANMHKED
ncbi:helix-turn-helix domain-containing protein [Virgibacillus salarius]|uniref:PucR family transcriptional regulator n=1 Tax=Virgibacillus salarius TaxID=447199 RepID=UPI00248F8AF4|nr:helix-turn-helix domain-containing protein [Virgibacillus salarius]WBX80066.1 helix-turn-helix domain-containing protein [Virgibacillus salarius]